MVRRLSNIEKKFKQSIEYAIWRDSVFRRDKWTCKICGLKGKRIEAHHIFPFRDYPDLRTEIKNGITLCFWCHRQIFGKEIQVASRLLGLIENGVNSVELLKKENTEPSRDSDVSEGVTTRERILDISQFFKKKVRCSSCRKTLYRHYYRTICSKRFFCNQQCHSLWQKKGLKGKNNSFYKPRQRIKCLYCGKFTSTPSQRHSKKKYCNNTCQLKYEFKNGLRKKPQKLNKWSRKYDKCIICGGLKRHYGKGKCMDCYNKIYQDSNFSKKTPPERDDIV